jgi:hypothetical protein
MGKVLIGLGAIVAIILGLSHEALADPANLMCWNATAGQWQPCSASNPLSTTGGGSSGGTVTLAAGTALAGAFNVYQGGSAVATGNALFVQPGTGASFSVTGTFWQATQPVTLPPSSINGSGSVTHSAVTTAYAANQLFLNNTTGNAVPMQVTVTGTNAGTGFITHAMCETSGTGATAPPGFKVYLFSAAPTVTSLVDRSAYVGPYAADITGGLYLGAVSCAAFSETNDNATTGPWFSEGTTSNSVLGPLPFAAASGETYLFGLVVLTGAYTPISGEKFTLLLSTARDQ